MYETFQSNKRPDLAAVPAEMPLDILLVLPDYVTNDPGAPLFNLPGAIAVLLGRFGWERATKILKPRIWAPGWDDAALGRFVTSGFLDHPNLFKGAPTAELRFSNFPSTGFSLQSSKTNLLPFDIVHIIGHFDWKDGERALKLSEADDSWLNVAPLFGVLTAMNTRLLILQVPHRHIWHAAEVSKSLVDSGLPAIILVAARIPAIVDIYLMDVYANIVHNLDLQAIARPKPWLEQTPQDLTVKLFYGTTCDDILRFDRWLDRLQARLVQSQLDVVSREEMERTRLSELRNRLDERRQRLHKSQVTSLKARIQHAEARIPQFRSAVEEMSGELGESLHWAHESGGAEPLSRIAELVPTLEAEADQLNRLYPLLEQEVQAAEERAPRVLNANFGDPRACRVLDPLEGLVAEQEYDLLVDVGPTWDKVSSIVSDCKDFPEQALRPDKEGYLIDIVFLSDDFASKRATRRIWLPRGRGRSHPVVDGRPAPASGPISLRIRAPKIPVEQFGEVYEAHGRLFLYYENNLLQSAMVRAGVVPIAGVWLKQRNSIDVDFVLTATFQQLAESFARREVQFTPDEDKKSHPIAVNITLNQDARGTHRILVQGRDDLSPAWMAYDPVGAWTTLNKARTTLMDCNWQRDDRGGFATGRDGERLEGLNGHNGKTLLQMRYDLVHLAKAGQSLYNQMLSGLRVDEVGDRPLNWERRLREKLSESSIIQVSRIESAPTQYAFPWALLYEYPLGGTTQQLRWCDVLWEWADEGIRDKAIASSCPYTDQPWHKENVLCPYGFWGLKHIIEQPLASSVKINGYALRDAAKEIVIGQDIVLSVGWTTDSTLNLAQMDTHIKNIRRIRGMRLADPSPNPADDRDTIRAVLAAPNLVYFICHCERDPAESEPYLYVGPRDGREMHKIYVNTVQDWARSTLHKWEDLRPLVFINGCHTSDLRPGEILNFVSAFGLAGAAGVIGTEVSVKLPIAIEIAERLFHKLFEGEGGKVGKVGQAMREIRWELANKGNLLGLCYTPYCLSDLHLLRS